MFSIKQITEAPRPKVSHLSPIDPPTSKKQGIQLSHNADGIFLPSFIMGIFGGPGSGKSSFVQHLIREPDLFSQRFERVIFVGPTIFPNLIQDEYNHCKSFDLEWIVGHIKEANSWKCRNMLVIFDDVIASFKNCQSRTLIELFYNRRHLLTDGTISILVTSQKWNMLPLFIRNHIDLIVMFKQPRQQHGVMADQLNLSIDKKQFQLLNSALKKHQFLFINNQSTKVFNSKWQQV